MKLRDELVCSISAHGLACATSLASSTYEAHELVVRGMRDERWSETIPSLAECYGVIQSEIKHLC